MGSVLEKNSNAVRKRIEGHTFTDEGGEEYEGSEFGGFGDYFRRKKIKLQNLDAEIRASSGDKPQIFKGIVVHVMGYTTPPLHILHKELVQHGAGFLQYLDSKTMATHIVASSLPPKKTVDYSRYRIVKPTWVTDSIAAGKLLPWSDYRLIDYGPRQKTIKLDGGKMFSQATQPSQQRYREQTESGFYTSQLKKAEGRASSSTPGATSPGQLLSHDNTPEPTSAGPVKAEMDPMAEDFELLDPGDDMADIAWDSVFEPVAETAHEIAPVAATMIDEPISAEPTENSPVNETKGPGAKPHAQMTSEEHNAWLLSDPHIRKSSSANPEFLKQFYSESRLHHLSTWKAELKSSMQKMANERGLGVKSIKRKPGARRYIMHVDFDSFFCAVSLKKAPEYVDKPAVVAHGTGAGSEIASCNYPARKFGVKNGMWMKRALELCPELKVLPYDFPAYEDASRQFYEALLEVGGVVQSVSVDEALVDITAVVLKAAGSEGYGVDEGSIWREQEKANEIAASLREHTRRNTGCEVSVGIGANILQAKVALRKAKPAGQFQLKPEEVLDILGKLKVEELPGVAWSIGGKLEEIGVKLVEDVRQTSRERLIATLGPKTGEKLWEYARGLDKTEVGEQSGRKSVSAEISWGIRFINQTEAEEFVYNLCKELERRLLNESVKGKHLTVKIMRRALDAPLDPVKHLGHGKCDTFNRSVAFGVATHSADAIGREAVAVLRSLKFTPGDLRGIGVQLTRLEPIKFSGVGADSSQKKLSFGALTTTPKAAKPEAIEDDDGTPPRPKPASSKSLIDDPIAEDPLTPRKPRTHAALALARASAADGKAQSPLNLSGTQFVLPPNPDPAVLAELPNDIRSRLKAQGRDRQEPPASESGEASPAVRSRNQSPSIAEDIPSDVDPEVFKALPDDMKAEILASYGRKGGRGAVGPQNAPAQSPWKDRGVRTRGRKKTVTPSKRGGIKGMFSRGKEQAHDAEAHLVQTNFLPPAKKPDAAAATSDDEEGLGDNNNNNNNNNDTDDELDKDFLSELPEDMRREVVADHRRRRLARRSRLHVADTARHGKDDHASLAAAGQTRLAFPGPPPKAAFPNAADMTSEPQLRDMLMVWRESTRGAGPHAEDVAVFERYLVRAVLEERDLAKVRNLLRWLAWHVEEDDGDGGGNAKSAKEAWLDAVEQMKSTVQAAVRKRGLGPVDFG